MNKKLLAVISLSGLSALGAAPEASAFDFSSFTSDSVTIADGGVDSSFDVNWLLPSSSGPTSDLVVAGVFNVTKLTSSVLDLTIKLTNNTASSYQAALMSMGLAVDPNATGSMLSAGNVFSAVTVGNGPNQTFPGGFKLIDACVYNATANSCDGTSINDGLQSGGKSDTFSLELAGDFGSSPSVTLGLFPVKFQTSNGSFEFGGIPGPCTGTDCGGGQPSEVPEPASLALIGLGTLAGVLNGRRRKSTRLT